jgi:hypothetical protein
MPPYHDDRPPTTEANCGATPEAVAQVRPMPTGLKRLLGRDVTDPFTLATAGSVPASMTFLDKATR